MGAVVAVVLDGVVVVQVVSVMAVVMAMAMGGSLIVSEPHSLIVVVGWASSMRL
jgi:hypothetical protein